MPSVSALQIVPSSGETDTLDDHTRARGHRHLSHLSSQQIEDAIRRCGGNLSAAAAQLGVGRSTLYTRTTEEPSLLATRDEILESFVDEAEAVIVSALRRGDVNAATFVLRTRGHARGWSTWAARHEGEQRPEPQRPKVDITAALRALSPAELQQLEAIVGKLEASAKAEAHERDADDEASRRPFRRGRLRGGASEVDEVEAVELTAQAILSTPDKLTPDEVDPSAEADGAVSSRDETEPGDISKPE